MVDGGQAAGNGTDGRVQTEAVATATLEASEPQAAASTAVCSRSTVNSVNDEWRRWIAENLMLEQAPEGLLAAMTGAGVDHDEAAKEIELAMQSPYVKGWS